MSIKPTPVAICTKCGYASCRGELINERCPYKDGRTRCTGIMGSAMSATDWKLCTVCGGSGAGPAGKCEECEGYGWAYVRKPN